MVKAINHFKLFWLLYLLHYYYNQSHKDERDRTAEHVARYSESNGKSSQKPGLQGMQLEMLKLLHFQNLLTDLLDSIQLEDFSSVSTYRFQMFNFLHTCQVLFRNLQNCFACPNLPQAHPRDPDTEG